MALLIDTSVIVTLERRHQPIRALLDLVGDEFVALASITASELLVGVHLATSPQQQAARGTFINQVFNVIPGFPFDLQVARIHALVWAEAKRAGQMIGNHDLIIAATALTHGYNILTENARHFTRVPGLVVRQPTWN